MKAFDKYPLPTRAYNIATIAPTSYFVSEVVQRLLADPRLGPDVPTRRNLIYHGGLRITTTYDPTLQTEAETAVQTHDRRRGATNRNIPVTGALVAIDNSNGAVRAMVSGSGAESGAGYLKQQFNYATGANRQVGSSFKVFTLATALENGYSPDDTIDGSSGCTIPPGLTTDRQALLARWRGRRRHDACSTAITELDQLRVRPAHRRARCRPEQSQRGRARRVPRRARRR